MEVLGQCGMLSAANNNKCFQKAADEAWAVGCTTHT